MRTVAPTRLNAPARRTNISSIVVPARRLGDCVHLRRAAGGGIYSLTSAAGYVLVVFMSAAAETPTPTTEPSRSGRLLDLVRKLIDYGRELAATIRQRTATDPTFVKARFGTIDLVVILARIIRGLLRAEALEARVLRRAAHLDAGPRPAGARSAAKAPAVPRPAAETDPRSRPACPPRSRSRPRSAAGRSAPSSPISAAISASRRAIRCGGTCNGPSSSTAAASSAWRWTSSTGHCPQLPGPRPRSPQPHATTDLAVRGTRRHRAALNLSPDDRGVTHGASQPWRAPPS